MSKATITPLLGGTVREFDWSWKKQPLTLVYEVLGEGRPILLLPALSSVSTRQEMQGVADRLAQHFQVVVLDWPGFGQSSRPPIDYSPAVYTALLRDFVQTLFPDPIVVIAAGHTAGYVMQLAQHHPPLWSWVVMVAPTWRGPLPTTLGDRRWFYKLLRFLVRLPLVGQFLYFLNTLPPLLWLMYRRQGYGHPGNITGRLIGQKWRTTQRRGGRFASAAFITGALDPVSSRAQFFDYFQPLPVPALMVIGEEMPPRSRGEIEVLAHFSGVQVLRMPGALALHEENPETLVNGILPFLKKYLS